MRWCASPPSSATPFMVSRGSGGTYTQRRRSVEETWAPGGLGGAPPNIRYHHLSIVGPWLSPKGSCEGSTCKDLAGKAVPRSVVASKCMMVGWWIRVNSILAIG
jgi:hypothetical protein